jgi:CBS domain-containing protein
MPTVADHMTRDVLTIPPSSTLGDAAGLMAQRTVGAVLVVEGESIAAIFTERDVMKAVAAGCDGSAPIVDWMTPHPDTIEPSDTTDHAASLMIHGGYRHLPVVGEGRIVGIVSIRDLMRVVLDDRTPRGV